MRMPTVCVSGVDCRSLYVEAQVIRKSPVPVYATVGLIALVSPHTAE